MIWLKRALSFSAMVFLATGLTSRGAEEPLKFDEVFKLLEANLPGVSKAELENAAAIGLLKELSGKVELAPEGKTNAATSTVPAEKRPVAKQAVYYNAFGYIRISTLEDGVSAAFSESLKGLSSSNKLKGLVVDLRYATGQNYEEASKVADLFLGTEREILKWGSTTTRSTAKGDSIKLPLVLLVNGQTSGAAEALAAILRETETGVIIGAKTAGQARIFENFKLSDGRTIRIAKASIQLAGGDALPDSGVTPDIAVMVNSTDEKSFFQNPSANISRVFAGISRSATNGAAGETNRTRRLFNEAELVRRHKEGIDFNPSAVDSTGNPGDKEEETGDPTITDPALARGLDFLKGVSVLQKSRSL